MSASCIDNIDVVESQDLISAGSALQTRICISGISGWLLEGCGPFRRTTPQSLKPRYREQPYHTSTQC